MDSKQITEAKAPKYQVVGVNDDRDFCECCGKKGLKRVVFIENLETGEVKHFGTTCATAPSKGFGLDLDIKAAVKRFADHEKAISHAAHYAYRKAGGKYTANADGYSCRASDPAMFAQCRNEVAARAFSA